MDAGLLADPKLHMLLLTFDEDLAAECRAGGCPRCAGKLHSARYPRKPRGVGAPLPAEYGFRFSFCCAIEGCRKRTTPASLRYLGSKVYLAVVVVLVTAMAHGLTGRRVAALSDRIGVSVRTLRRWQRWWREAFVSSSLWKVLRGRFVPPISADSLPGRLLERCAGEDDQSRLIALLRLLSPLMGTRLSREGR